MFFCRYTNRRKDKHDVYIYFIPLSSYRGYHRWSLFVNVVTSQSTICQSSTYIRRHKHVGAKWFILIARWPYLRIHVTGGGSAPGPIERPPYLRFCPTGNLLPVTSKFTHIIYIFATGGGSASGSIEFPPYIRCCPTGNQCCLRSPNNSYHIQVRYRWRK